MTLRRILFVLLLTALYSVRLALADVPAAPTVTSHNPASPAAFKYSVDEPSIDVKVDSAGPTVIPSNPVGISIETWHLTHFAGSAKMQCQKHPFIEAIKLLGTPDVRVGGNSQDNTSFKRGSNKFDAGSTYRRSWRCAASLGGRVNIGLNFRSDSLSTLRQTVKFAQNNVPRRQLSFGLGNEPELYRNWHTKNHQLKYKRIERKYRATKKALPTLSLWGPNFSTGRFLDSIGSFARDTHPQQIALHTYPLLRCRLTPASPNWPTREKLANVSSSIGMINRLKPAIREGVRRGIPVVISEMNSVACRGLAGVSDDPVSAMWAVDTIAAAAAAGISGSNFHISDSVYDPLYKDSNKHLRSRPLWNGMRFAADHMEAGAHFAAISSPLPKGITAWATRSSKANTIILLNHTNKTQSFSVHSGGSKVNVYPLISSNKNPFAEPPLYIIPTEEGVVNITLPPYGVTAVKNSLG